MNVICPLCRQPLLQAEKRWYCDNNHSFDIAKQGYTNLLPVQNKKSKSPGDDAAMVAARSQFLNGGYYQPLSDQLNQIILNHLQQNTLVHSSIVHPSIIDAGCGEGYYTAQLRTALSQNVTACDITGIDISKHATLAAAKRDKAIDWFVANSSALPAADHCADILLSLFAPIQAEEFHRCINTEGLLLVASTGKKHLIELRELLYDDVRDNVFDAAAAIDQYFTLTDTSSANFTIDLPDTITIKNLLAMTPHYWRVSPERKTVLDTLDKLSVTVDIQLHRFRPD